MKENILLSICIPTYNRCFSLQKLLCFLHVEFSRLSIEKQAKIEFLVGNNNSIDLTEEKCLSSDLFLSYNYHTQYIRNVENLGTERNLVELVKRASGKYVWFVGDDDIYHENILAKIYDKLNADTYSFVFVNHCAYIKSMDDGTGFSSAIPENLPLNNGSQLMLDIFRQSTTSLMFVSAQIHNKESVQAAMRTNVKINMAYTLFLSFYSAAQGKVGVLEEVLIDNVWGEPDWGDKARAIFMNYVPHYLWLLPKIGYNYRKSRMIFFWYMLSKHKALFIGYTNKIRTIFGGRK